LFWMSFPPRRKSPTVGSDILFRFVSLSSMSRVGAWKSKSEWREEGVGDQPRCLLLSRRERSWGRAREVVATTWIFCLPVFFLSRSLFGSCVSNVEEYSKWFLYR
jgi:hypothetical protein